MTAPWPDDLCVHCPYADMCDLTDPAEEDGGCRRVWELRDAEERKAEGER
jgi:hypothetical protein